MQPHPLGNFFGANFGQIWANLIRFGQNQNLASPQNIRSPKAMFSSTSSFENDGL